jgi:transcription termination factor NusA
MNETCFLIFAISTIQLQHARYDALSKNLLPKKDSGILPNRKENSVATELIEVTGVGPATLKNLKEAGITSAEELASAKLGTVMAIPGFSEIRATRVINAAKEILKAEPVSKAKKPKAGKSADKASAVNQAKTNKEKKKSAKPKKVKQVKSEKNKKDGSKKKKLGKKDKKSGNKKKKK